jgi:integrase
MARKNLTRASVESLTYRTDGPHKQIAWDAKVRGFGARITPEGGKSYVLLYRVQGRQRLMSLGRVDEFASLDAARTKASGLLQELKESGTDPMAARERMSDAQSLDALWAVYERDHLAHTSVNTRRAVSSTWRVHVQPIVGSLNPAQVTKGDVVRVHDKATQHGKVVANRAVVRLKAMLTWLHERNEKQFHLGWKNPALGFKLHRENERTAILDLEQQRALLISLKEETCPWTRVYLQMLLLTGCRANELLSLRWSDVNFDKSVALIQRSSAHTEERKNHRDLTIPLAPIALELLRSLPVIAGTEYVFPSPRKPAQPYTSNAIRRRYEDALTRAKLPHRTLHDLRRSYGTNIARHGASTKLIAGLLGNTSEVTSRVYIQLAADDLRQFTERNASNILPAKLP